MNYFGSIYLKSTNAGCSTPDHRLNSMNGTCAKTIYSHWTFLVDAYAWKFWGKTKLYYFIFSAPCPKIVFAPLRGLMFIDAANKFRIFQKQIGILLAT